MPSPPYTFPFAALQPPPLDLLHQVKGSPANYSIQESTRATEFLRSPDFVIDLPVSLPLHTGSEVYKTIDDLYKLGSRSEDDVWHPQVGDRVRALLLQSSSWRENAAHTAAFISGKKKTGAKAKTPVNLEGRKGVTRKRGYGPPVRFPDGGDFALFWFLGYVCTHTTPEGHRCPTTIYVCGRSSQPTNLYVFFQNNCWHAEASVGADCRGSIAHVGIKKQGGCCERQGRCQCTQAAVLNCSYQRHCREHLRCNELHSAGNEEAFAEY